MFEKPKIDLRRFKPQKISSRYWMKFALYALILTGLYFWRKEKSKSSTLVKISVEQNELNLKGLKIEEKH